MDPDPRLCTGGTLTMAPNPEKDGALTPVPGALTDYLKSMMELTNEKMPDVVVHEYSPLLDSSDMGPPDWALLGKAWDYELLTFDISLQIRDSLSNSTDSIAGSQ